MFYDYGCFFKKKNVDEGQVTLGEVLELGQLP
jgi:hypothetical protein